MLLLFFDFCALQQLTLWAISAFSQRANLHNIQELLQPTPSIYEQMSKKELQHSLAASWYFTGGLDKCN